MANALTIARIALSVVLVALPALSPTFLAVYATAGITDLIDGAVARRTHTESALGAALDSVADLMLAAVCLVKVLPAISPPVWLVLWVGAIASARVCTLLYSIVTTGRPLMLHTTANKVAGLLCFLVPLMLPLAGLALPAICACVAATVATVHESLLVRSTARETPPPRRPPEAASHGTHGRRREERT